MKISIIIAVLLTSFGAMAQNANIKGRVTTADGKPAEFVSINLKGTKKGTLTDENGNYALKFIKAGNYTLETKFVGLLTQEKNVLAVADQTTTIDFVLSENAQQLAEVVVKEYQTANNKPTAIGKIAIRPMDLPQSVAIIDQRVLEQQQVLRISDALMNTTGVYIMGTTGGYQEEIAGRGYAFGSSNTFKNGARYFNGIIQETSALEKVEFLKGSSAILFGNVAAGGLLNLVTKKPKFENGGSISMRVGSFDFYKPSLDIYGAINNSQNAAYRINTSYEKANSFREGVSSERFYINPSFLFKVGKKTEILLEGDYLKDNRTPDYGTGAVNYVIADVPRERFLGVAWSRFNAEQKGASLNITHRLNENWQVRATAALQNYSYDLYANTRPNAGNFVQKDGKWIRGLAHNQAEDTYFVAQLDLTGKFQTGSVGHQLLAGTDTDQYNTKTTAYTGITKYDSLNIFNPALYKVRNDIPDLAKNTLTNAPIDRFGVYVQDLISLGTKFKLLAGLRYSYQQSISDVYTFSTQKNVITKYFDGAFSPRFGLVYQPTKMTSVFASYSNSFTLNTGTDRFGNVLEPSTIDQYEVGLKNELIKGLLSANITYYQIVNSNLAQTDLTNGNTNTSIKELAGQVTSKGIEVDLVSKPYKGVSIIAGYSYNDTKYTKSNTYIVGSRLRYNPQHTANASIFYTFQEKTLKDLQVGFTSLYVGERVAGRSYRVQVANDTYKLMSVPNYMQFDASLGYSVSNFSIRVKMANLLNKLSYNIHDDNSVNPIAPRNFSATVTYKF